jgi:uncharacterized membrane protein YcaP (DUF421 family)
MSHLNHTPPPPTSTKPYKAIAAFLLTFVGALVATIQGRPSVEGMTVLDWVIVVGSALVTAGTVYGVTNPAKGV